MLLISQLQMSHLNYGFMYTPGLHCSACYVVMVCVYRFFFPLHARLMYIVFRATYTFTLVMKTECSKQQVNKKFFQLKNVCEYKEGR